MVTYFKQEKLFSNSAKITQNYWVLTHFELRLLAIVVIPLFLARSLIKLI